MKLQQENKKYVLWNAGVCPIAVAELLIPNAKLH